MIEKTIVLVVDEELGGSRVGIHGTSHGEGAAFVFQPVVRLVLDWSTGGLFPHIFIEPAALDHEALDDPMEDGPVVETRVHVGQEVRYGRRGLVGIELDSDGPLVSNP